MKKLFLILLVIMSVFMCTPEPELDYKVTKLENYNISEKEMKKISLEVKKAYERNTKEHIKKLRNITKESIEFPSEGKYDSIEAEIFMDIITQIAISSLEKGSETQKIQTEEIRLVNDIKASVTGKIRILNGDKLINKFQNGNETLNIAAQKLQYKNAEDMINQMEKMSKEERLDNIRKVVNEVVNEEEKNEENYVERTITTLLVKENNIWKTEGFDEAIQNYKKQISKFK